MPSKPRREIYVIAAITIVAALLGLAINVASQVVPSPLQRYPWLAWLALIMLMGVTVGIEALRLRWSRSVTTDGATVPNGIYRKRMIARVTNAWIEGALYRSLDAVARAERQSPSQHRPTRPWNLVLALSGQLPQQVPPDVPVIDVFQKVEGALLVVGDPGAGKTTLLLELLRDLLVLSSSDSRYPVPVVFNLGSWAPPKSIERWLVDELQAHYDVAVDIGDAWIRHDQIMPLLDGLDEVDERFRSRCVEAINRFRRRDHHGMGALVVCSRTNAYEPLPVRLHAQATIRVEPPTAGQVQDYLAEMGIEPAGLRTMAKDDRSLLDLLRSPLRLSLLALLQRGSLDPRVATGTLQQRQAGLVAAFVDEMFARRAATAGYDRQQAERWLAWLAASMKQHNQVVFELEALQPSWLPARQQRLATVGVTAAGALVGAFASALAVELILKLTDWLYDLPQRGTVLGLPAWLLTGVGFGAAVGFLLHDSAIRPVEQLRWSWVELRSSLRARLPVGMLLALIAGAIFGIEGGLRVALAVRLFFGLTSGMLALALYLLIGGLTSGLHRGLLAPNEGMRRSRRNAVVGGLPFAVPFGVLTAVLYGTQFGGAQFGAITGLHTMLPIWVLAGLWAGGRAYLRHLAVRALLWRTGRAPWGYVAFLDDATDRLILQRVGRGYRFVHALLLDHFANLN